MLYTKNQEPIVPKRTLVRSVFRNKNDVFSFDVPKQTSVCIPVFYSAPQCRNSGSASLFALNTCLSDSQQIGSLRVVK